MSWPALLLSPSTDLLLASTSRLEPLLDAECSQIHSLYSTAEALTHPNVDEYATSAVPPSSPFQVIEITATILRFRWVNPCRGLWQLSCNSIVLTVSQLLFSYPVRTNPLPGEFHALLAQLLHLGWLLPAFCDSLPPSQLAWLHFLTRPFIL